MGSRAVASDPLPSAAKSAPDPSFFIGKAISSPSPNNQHRYASAGVPGLEGPEAKDNLCRYAVRSGSISATDLEHIP